MMIISGTWILLLKLTIDLLSLKPGPYSYGYITKFLSDRKRNKSILDIFLSAVGVILAIVAIFATGGLAAFAVIGGTAIGGYQTSPTPQGVQFSNGCKGVGF